MIKKLGYFLALCAYVLGAIGGFGCAMYIRSYAIAVAVVVLAVMAFPTAKKLLDKMME